MSPLPRLHLSVDDVLNSVADLFEDDYRSIWEHRHFGHMRSMQERYGAVFSLYCFYRSGDWDLSLVDARFNSELADASSWLRWGFHGLDKGTDYGSGVSPQEASRHYRQAITALTRLAGETSLDRLPRIHWFAGTRSAVRAWRDAPFGIYGLLTADDARESVYYIQEPQRSWLAGGEELYDEDEGLLLMPTDVRLERESDPVAVLEKRLRKGQRSRHALSVFTHEQHLDSPEVQARTEQVCRWAAERGLEMGFPADALYVT